MDLKALNPRSILRSTVFRAGAAVVLFLGASIFISSGFGGLTGGVGTYEGVVKGAITPIGAQRDGRIAEIPVDPGTMVTEGEVLVRMHDADEEAQVAKRRAELKLAELAVERKSIEIEKEEMIRELSVQRAEAQVNAAESRRDASMAEAERWRAERERKRRLAESDNIPEARLQETRAAEEAALSDSLAARADVTVAEAELESAKAEVEALDSERAELKMLRAEVDRAEAGLAEAEAALDATVLRAATDGWIVDWRTGPGGSVRAGDPVIEQWISERLWVETYVDQDVLSRVESGQRVSVEFAAISGEQFPGHVQSMQIASNAADESAGAARVVSPLLPDNPTYAVRIQLTEFPSEIRLLPGLSATVDFDPEAGVANAGPSKQSVPSAGLDLTDNDKTVSNPVE